MRIVYLLLALLSSAAVILTKTKAGMKFFSKAGGVLNKIPAAGKYTAYTRRLLKMAECPNNYENSLKEHFKRCLKYYFSINMITGFIAFGACSESNGTTSLQLFVMGTIIAAVSPIYFIHMLREEIKEKNRLIKLEFPVFLNKVVLLVNAGSTVSNAWKSAIKNSEKSKNPLYRELNYVKSIILRGCPESEALTDMASRTRVPEVVRSIGVLTVNLKKGGADVISNLTNEMHQCFEMRKNASKLSGELLSSKIILPMTIALLAMMLAVGAPAYFSLKL